MSVIIDGTAGITTPSETNTGTLSVAGAVTLTTTLGVLQGGTGVTTKTGTGAVVLGTGPSISSAVMTTMASSVLTSGTAQTYPFSVPAAIDFTGIPSWVKRITVMLNGVSTNGSSLLRIQVGSGSVSASGYAGFMPSLTSGQYGGGNQYTNNPGFDFANFSPSAANAYFGVLTLNLISANTWIVIGFIGSTGTASGGLTAAASPALSGALDRVRITTVNGTDTFDAGSINILYE